MAVIVCWAVFTRYVLNSSLVWYDEFASYLLVWLTFYGAVVADYQRRHIGFDLLVNKLAPARAGSWISWASSPSSASSSCSSTTAGS